MPIDLAPTGWIEFNGSGLSLDYSPKLLDYNPKHYYGQHLQDPHHPSTPTTQQPMQPHNLQPAVLMHQLFKVHS
jgi:hypothetical protein